MSHAAVAAALALNPASTGERLAALSLASFANRSERAWPGHELAAARAGLSRSQYLVARDRLIRRSLVEVEQSGGGRGKASTMLLRFASDGPWVDATINTSLLERTLGHSHSRGASRVLLAALAALSDPTGVVDGRSAEEIRQAAGLSDRSYRRASTQLIASGEVSLEQTGGGRSRPNRWRVHDPREVNARPLSASSPTPAPAAAAPLMAVTRAEANNEPLDTPTDEDAAVAADAVPNRPVLTGVSHANGPVLTGVTALNGPVLTGVSGVNGPVLTGVSPNTGQDRTVSSETPAKTPAETPAKTPPHARAGKESQNPGTNPPTPLAGGPAGSISITETTTSPRGRRRQRTTTVEVAQAHRELHPLHPEDIADWNAIRHVLEQQLGATMFEIWIAPLRPAARGPDDTLLLAGPPNSNRWLSSRYGAVIATAGQAVGRSVRIMTDREQQLHDALALPRPQPNAPFGSPPDHQEAV